MDQKSVYLGFSKMMPIMPSVMLFGIIFGITGNFTNLTLFLVSSMSYVIFAGSAQFLVIVLIADNQTLEAIIIAGIIINLRHLLFSANISELLEVSRLKRIFIAYLLTDEAFIVTTNVQYELDTGKLENNNFKIEDVLLGGGFTLWFLWNLSTIFGYLLANYIDKPGVSTNFIVSATFLGYLLTHWKNSPAERKFILVMSIISLGFSFFLQNSDLIIVVLLFGIILSIIFKHFNWVSTEEIS